MRVQIAVLLVASLALSGHAFAGQRTEIRVVDVPFDPRWPSAPVRAIVPITVGTAPTVVAPVAVGVSNASDVSTNWEPPAEPVAVSPVVPRASLEATADTTSPELDNPFAAAREEAVAEAMAPPAVEERYVPDGPIRGPLIPPPAPKACLTAADSQGAGVQVAGVGLSGTQIRSVIDSFAPRTAGCLPSGTRGQFTVMASVSVGCSGVVSEVLIAPGSGLPAPVTSCLEYSLGSAPFPAHDRAGGVSFEVPITYGQ